MDEQVVIRVWKDNTVVGMFTVSESTTTMIGRMGGAGSALRPDIELDPWANFIVDHRYEYARPVDVQGNSR